MLKECIYFLFSLICHARDAKFTTSRLPLSRLLHHTRVCSYLHVSLVVTNRPHKTAQKCQLPPHLPFVGYGFFLSPLSPLPVASFGSSVVRVCFFSFLFFFIL